MASICTELMTLAAEMRISERLMPDKICRTCGEELISYSQCFECKRPIQQICIKCGKKTIERFHLGCFKEARQNLSAVIGMSLAE